MNVAKLTLAVLATALVALPAAAQEGGAPTIEPPAPAPLSETIPGADKEQGEFVQVDDAAGGLPVSRKDVADSLKVVFVMTALSLLPALLVMATSFTRIVVVLGFLRVGLATPNLPPNNVLLGLALASIVSSPQLGTYAAAHGVEYAETLTGFKWIANDALTALAERNALFVFGYEEAIGFTVGEVVRDKDGIGAALILCELVATLKQEGKTLLDRLEELHRETGCYVSSQRSTVFPGQEGSETFEAQRTQDSPPVTVFWKNTGPAKT